MDYVIGLLNDRLSILEDGYNDLVINGDVKEKSEVAIQNRDRVRELKLAISALAKNPDASENTLPIDDVSFSLPFMDLEQAEKEAMETDYACFAVGEDVNTGDAGAFYLEGYNKARMLLGNES